MKKTSKSKTGNRRKSASDNLIFALDIGTRSIIGVVGMMQEDRFQIMAIETIEHEKRAMIDGQIEDIAEVAAVAGRVKAALENKLGFALRKVCVAAAGRALKTHTAEFSKTLSPKESVDKETVYALEMAAVSKASEALASTEAGLDFYCVGYSVKRFYLDNYAYSNVVGHKGKDLRVEVIATFLPSEVVESLSAAMSKIGLEIDFLTLEPIAAMNAVIPTELRLLNLALVDIGAGTSDIAICEESSVTAYTMATVAGDEITEEIIRKYLVDFSAAEVMKHALSTDAAEVSYQDIMGFEYTVTTAELLASLSDAIGYLSKVICDKILEANAKAPSAVFLVGGGSKIPTLCAGVAQRLGIDPRKVAVGGNNFLKRVILAEQDLRGPEYATPLGIALTAASAGDHRGFSITLNGEKKQLFRGTVMPLMDVLLLSGYKYGDILGKNGRSIEYTLNGKRCIARGSYLKPAEFLINGESANISSPVKSGDQLSVTAAKSGRDAVLKIDQLAQLTEPINVYYNGTMLEAGCFAAINGRRAVSGQLIHNKDKIEVVKLVTLEDFRLHVGITDQNTALLINNVVRPEDYHLQNGDIITAALLPAVGNASKTDAPTENSAAAFVAPSPVQSVVSEVVSASAQAHLTPQPMPVLVNPIEVILNGAKRVLPPKPNEAEYLFIDMLNLVDIDPSKPQGDIILRLNGEDAAYLMPIKSGDRVDIFWAERTQHTR